MARCICINDKNRPKEIPSNQWVEHSKEYNIIDIQVLNKQNKILGVQLEEIDLDENNHPYYFFRLDRFLVRHNDLDLFMAIFRASQEVTELITEQEILELI
jgi:hypothetical protein